METIDLRSAICSFYQINLPTCCFGPQKAREQVVELPRTLCFEHDLVSYVGFVFHDVARTGTPIVRLPMCLKISTGD